MRIPHGLRAALASQGAAPAPSSDANFENVSLLLHGDGTNGAQNNTFTDDSANNFTITRNGNTTQGTFSPFSPTRWSGYFDGSGDYLSVADNAALQMGSGDFTIEFWLNFSSLTGYQTLFNKGYTSAGSLLFQTDNGNGRMRIYIGSSNVISETGTGSTNTWIHYALVRSGTTLTLYRDGTSSGSATNSTNINNASTLYIGSSVTTSPDYPFTGYISNLRIVKGTAVYTSNFTPPTAPLTAITNTSLLLNFTNGGIIDNASKNVLETIGTAQISTSVKKFGTGSMYFGGTGACFIPPVTESIKVGSGDFTIELWLYWASSLTPAVWWASSTSSILISDVAATYAIISSSTDTASGYSRLIDAPSSLSANTWGHVAVVRSSGTTKIYLNGTVGGSTSSITGSFDCAYVGFQKVGGRSLNGYIDDLRITKGVARYTANFTPPTAAFPDL